MIGRGDKTHFGMKIYMKIISSSASASPTSSEMPVTEKVLADEYIRHMSCILVAHFTLSVQFVVLCLMYIPYEPMITFMRV